MGGTPTGIENANGLLINPSTNEATKSVAGVLAAPFREFEVLTKDADGRPLTVAYRTTPSGSVAFTLTIVYDALGNVEKVSQT